MILILLLNLFENSLFPCSQELISHFNPAYLFEMNKRFLIGGEEKFGLSELRTYFLDIQMDQFGFNYTSFGNELYRENLLELKGAFRVWNQMGLGLSATLLNCWIKDIANRYTYTLKMGGIYKLYHAEIGLLLGNINRPQFSYIDYLPFIYFINSRYEINNNLVLYFNIAGLEDSPPSFDFGVIVLPIKEFKIFAGLDTENFLFKYGIGVALGRLSFIYNGINHYQLGLSHALFITFIKN